MNWPSPPASQTGQLKFPWKYVTLLYCYFRSVQWPMEISAPVSSQIHSYQLGHWPLQWPTCPAVCPRVNKRKKKKFSAFFSFSVAPLKKNFLGILAPNQSAQPNEMKYALKMKKHYFFLIIIPTSVHPPKSIEFHWYGRRDSKI